MNEPMIRSIPTPWANRAGFLSALTCTIGGILYFFAILWAILTGHFTFPPAEGLQLFAGILSLLLCPLLVLMMASLHSLTPGPMKVMSQVSLSFTVLFALAVSINRFSQLGVVRLAVIAGKGDGLSWFMPYGDNSIMLGLEYLGWGWFLGLAMLCAAPLFRGGRLERWLSGLMALYGVMGLVSAVGFMLGNWLSLVGFAAWGVVLFIIPGLLAVYFKRPAPG